MTDEVCAGCERRYADGIACTADPFWCNRPSWHSTAPGDPPDYEWHSVPR